MFASRPHFSLSAFGLLLGAAGFRSAAFRVLVSSALLTRLLPFLDGVRHRFLGGGLVAHRVELRARFGQSSRQHLHAGQMHIDGLSVSLVLRAGQRVSPGLESRSGNRRNFNAAATKPNPIAFSPIMARKFFGIISARWPFWSRRNI